MTLAQLRIIAWTFFQGSNWGDCQKEGGGRLGLCQLNIGIFEKCATLEISKNILKKAIFHLFGHFINNMYLHGMLSSIITKMGEFLLNQRNSANFSAIAAPKIAS